MQTRFARVRVLLSMTDHQNHSFFFFAKPWPPPEPRQSSPVYVQLTVSPENKNDDVYVPGQLGSVLCDTIFPIALPVISPLPVPRPPSEVTNVATTVLPVCLNVTEI